MYALIDCNNFYVSCERVFNPWLNNKPVIVLSNNDGCVIARSNESKKLGIKMGEPAFKIQYLINKYNIHVYSSNFALYGDMSNRVISTIASFELKMEVYSIDEVFLDISDFKKKDFYSIAYEIKSKIKQWTGIPVSIGIAETKTLSKAANYIAKKYNQKKGIFIIDENNTDKTLCKIPIGNVWGVGFKTKPFLKLQGIHTALDLKYTNLYWAKNYLTVIGERMVKELQGISCLSIESSFKTKKSICTSRTFGKMVTELRDLVTAISMYTTRCAEKLRNQNSYASFVTVFIYSNRFRIDLPQYVASRIIKFPIATSDTGEMLAYIIPVLKKMYKKGYYYKKAGVILGGIISNQVIQTNLFDTINRTEKIQLLNSVDNINKKMGRDIIRYAVQDYRKSYILKQQKLSQCYTTRWKELLNVRLSM